MDWRNYTRLSYAEERDFSQRRSIVGIVLIAVVSIVAGSISLYVHGQLRTCVPTYTDDFAKPQVEAGKAGCIGATLAAGELVYGRSFTYVVTRKLDLYRGEILDCSIMNKSVTINVVSFAAPQFVWAYEISCSRGEGCCPKEIKNTKAAEASCFCNQLLGLRIEKFSMGASAGSALLTDSSLNYASLNGSFSNIKIKNCPNGDPITVLRFDDSTYTAFSYSEICAAKDPKDSAIFEDPTISAAIDEIRVSVDDGINGDIKGLGINGLKFLMDVQFLCYSCSNTSDIGQLLLDFFIAISALGSVTYSLVIWVLKHTQRAHQDQPPAASSELGATTNSL